MVIRVWRATRLLVSVWLAAVSWSYLPTEQWDRQCNKLPDYPFEQAYRQAFDAGRLSEAARILDAADDDDVIPPVRVEAYRRSLAERAGSAEYRLAEAARGALTGTGASTPAITAALVTDLFVFGDVRDLVIQTARYARGEAVDPVIVALSGLGLGLTVAPAVDAGTALLKLARRQGMISRRMGRAMRQWARHGPGRRRLATAAGNVQALAQQTDPATALRLIRVMDHPDDIALALRMTRHHRAGAFALEVGGRQSLRLMKQLGPPGDRWIVYAARKGPAGLATLARAGRVAMRPHPWLGVAKWLHKGPWLEGLGRWLRQQAHWLRWVATLWCLVELVAWFRRRSAPAPAVP